MEGLNPVGDQLQILLKHSSPGSKRWLKALKNKTITLLPYTPKSASGDFKKLRTLKAFFSFIKHACDP